MDALALLILSCATWRIASMLVRERGPFDMFVWIRGLSGIQHDENKTPYMIPDNTLAGILSCVWCCSMWVAMGWTAFYLLLPVMAVKIAAVFAISAGSILLDRWTGN